MCLFGTIKAWEVTRYNTTEQQKQIRNNITFLLINNIILMTFLQFNKISNCLKDRLKKGFRLCIYISRLVIKITIMKESEV